MAGLRRRHPGPVGRLVRRHSRLHRGTVTVAGECAPAHSGRRREELRVKLLSEFGRFWYDLIVGDDWKIAASVVLALPLAGLLLTRPGAPDQVVAAVGVALVVAGFCVSLILD